MNWQIKIPSSAQRQLEVLADSVWREAMDAIADLSEDPFPSGSIPLRGHAGLYRIRIYRNQYRVVYRVSERQHKVVIERVRPRASAYRGL